MMIREMQIEDIEECVQLIRNSFQTVADAFGFTQENAPRFTAFATTKERLLWQFHTEKRPMYVYVNELDKIIGYYSLQKQSEAECELNNL